jgi:RNAse (barnase) inhibitor barstar
MTIELTLTGVGASTRSIDATRDFVARIPNGLRSRDELFAALRRELRLPEYFGDNWNALIDCLRDLSWIKEPRVLLIHADVPKLKRKDLVTYLEVLSDSVQDWQPREGHELSVSFHCDYLREIVGRD